MSEKPPAPAVKRDELDGASTVSVYCRLPHGIWMQAQEEQSYSEQTPSGVRSAKRFAPVGERVRIEGNAKGRGVDSDKTEHKRIIAGFAVTDGVPADLWRKWKAQNVGLEALIRGDIYAVAKAGDAAAKRDDADKVPTGLDPINPAALPAEFKRVERAAAA